MAKISKYVVSTVIVLLTIIAGIYFYIFNSPHRDVKNEDALIITADSLYTIYSNNEDGGNALFLDKTLQVTGEILDTLHNNIGQSVLLLKVNSELSSVVCTFTESIDNFIPSQIIIVKGICSGYDGIDVKVGKCMLVKTLN